MKQNVHVATIGLASAIRVSLGKSAESNRAQVSMMVPGLTVNYTPTLVRGQL